MPPSGFAIFLMAALAIQTQARTGSSQIQSSVYVDGSAGTDSDGCGTGASVAACKTINFGYTQGKQRLGMPHEGPLQVLVAPGQYKDECSETGIEITTANTSIHVLRGVGQHAQKKEMVEVDCNRQGKLLNISQPSSSRFELEGLFLHNGQSN